MNLALTALSYLYSGLVSIRNRLFDSGVFSPYQSSIPVISVGNITAGGNGKTPLVGAVVSLLKDSGFNPVILTRGYKGQEKGPYLVKSSDTATLVGDEALLLSKAMTVPVVVSRLRAEGAKLIEKEKLGDVIVLDDGFQHRWLARRLDIVTQDVSNPRIVDDFINSKVLPLGLMREGLTDAIARTDLVVLSHRGPRINQDAVSKIRAKLSGSLILESWMGDFTVCDVNGSLLKPQPVIALSAIGNPDGFWRSLEVAGFSVVERVNLKDHSSISEGLVSELMRKHPDIKIVITEKDRVKLSNKLSSLLYSLTSKLEFNDKKALVDLLIKKVTKIALSPL